MAERSMGKGYLLRFLYLTFYYHSLPGLTGVKIPFHYLGRQYRFRVREAEKEEAKFTKGYMYI